MLLFRACGVILSSNGNLQGTDPVYIIMEQAFEFTDAESASCLSGSAGVVLSSCQTYSKSQIIAILKNARHEIRL